MTEIPGDAIKTFLDQLKRVSDISNKGQSTECLDDFRKCLSTKLKIEVMRRWYCNFVHFILR